MLTGIHRALKDDGFLLVYDFRISNRSEKIFTDGPHDHMPHVST